MPESIIDNIEFKLPKVNKLKPGESMTIQIPKSRHTIDTGNILFIVDAGDCEATISYNEDNYLNVFSIKKDNKWVISTIIQTTSYGIVIITLDEDNHNDAKGTYYFFKENDIIKKMEFKFHFKGSIFDGVYFYEFMTYKGEVVEYTYNEDYTKMETSRIFGDKDELDNFVLQVHEYEFDMVPSVYIKKEGTNIEFIPNTEGDILIHVKSIEVEDGKFRQEYIRKEEK